MTEEQFNILIHALLSISTELSKNTSSLDAINENIIGIKEQLEEIDKSIVYIATKINELKEGE